MHHHNRGCRFISRGEIMKEGTQFQVHSLFQNRVVVVYLTLGLLLLVSWILKPFSVSGENMNSVLSWAAVLGMVAIGQTVVMIAGGIDLSVANIVFMTYVMASEWMGEDNAMILQGTLYCLALGGTVGLLNGLGIAFLRIPHLVMTLGVWIIIGGAVWLYTGGICVGTVPPALVDFGRSKVLGQMPGMLFVWLAMTALFSFIMNRTGLGRRFYAVGNNVVAARLSGVNIKQVTIVAYLISGLMSASAGVMFLGFMGMANLNFIPDIFTMGSVAAVVLGGTEFFSGIGSVIGTIAGAVILRFLFNLLIMFQVAEPGRMIANGLVILTVVLFYSFLRKPQNGR